MSGKNLILKSGDSLFKFGDKPDGMYIIRRGNIEVFLEQDGKRLVLASIGPGGMIGEMALFDKKPRSASAVAVGDVDVTQITNQEFSNILGQIPKWFVSLITNLSNRLRATNERLNELESKNKKNINKLDETLQVLKILQILWYKHGIKTEKYWTMDRDIVVGEISSIVGLDKIRVLEIITAIAGSKILLSGKSSNKDTLAVATRGDLDGIIKFIEVIKSKDGKIKSVPPELADILDSLSKFSKNFNTDSFSLDMKRLETEAKSTGLKTDSWRSVIPLLVDVDSYFVVSKDNNEVKLNVNKKSLNKLYIYSRTLYAATKSD